jgi:transaldolase
VYQAFREIFGSPRFDRLKQLGAMVQRPLWASTSTKNPAYPDLIYVEPLVGPQTVNTVPPVTYAAILDHAVPAARVENDLAGSAAVLRQLRDAGIDLPRAMKKLEDDGVASFAKSFENLVRTLEAKRMALRS